MQVCKYKSMQLCKHMSMQVNKSEVEKVKSVSGNLRMELKTFCKNEGIGHEKNCLLSKLILGLLKCPQNHRFRKDKSALIKQQFKVLLHFWDIMKIQMKDMSIF